MDYESPFEYELKKYLKYGIFVIIGVVILRVSVFYVFVNNQKNTEAQTEQLAKVSFEPSSIAALANQDFTTTIKIKSTPNITIRGYKIKVGFDKTKTRIKNIDYKAGVVSQGLGQDIDDKDSINNRGEIYLQAESYDPEGIIVSSTDKSLVELTFTSINTESNSITIDASGTKIYKFSSSDWVISEKSVEVLNNVAINGGVPSGTVTPSVTPSITIAPSNTPVPTSGNTPTPSPTGSVSSMNLNIKLKFQGVTKKPSDEYNRIDTKFILNGGTSQTSTPASNVTGRFTSDSAGIWSGSINLTNMIPASNYKIFVKGAKHLQKKICINNPTEGREGVYHCSNGGITLNSGTNVLNFSGIYLLVGDLKVNGQEQDGIIDSLDLAFIVNNLGKKATGTLDYADVNYDGVVDTQDYSLVIKALSFKYDEE